MLKAIILFKLAMMLMVYRYIPRNLMQNESQNQTKKVSNSSKIRQLPGIRIIVDKSLISDATNLSERLPSRTSDITEDTNGNHLYSEETDVISVSVTTRIRHFIEYTNYLMKLNISSEGRTTPLLTTSIKKIIIRSVILTTDVPPVPTKSSSQYRTRSIIVPGKKISLETEIMDKFAKESVTSVYDTDEMITGGLNIKNRRNRTNTSEADIPDKKLNMIDKNRINQTINRTIPTEELFMGLNGTLHLPDEQKYIEGNVSYMYIGGKQLRNITSDNNSKVNSTVKRGRVTESIAPKTDLPQRTIGALKRAAGTDGKLKNTDLRQGSSICDHACKFRKKLRRLLKNRYNEPR